MNGDLNDFNPILEGVDVGVLRGPFRNNVNYLRVHLLLFINSGSIYVCHWKYKFKTLEWYVLTELPSHSCMTACANMSKGTGYWKPYISMNSLGNLIRGIIFYYFEPDPTERKCKTQKV